MMSRVAWAGWVPASSVYETSEGERPDHAEIMTPTAGNERPADDHDRDGRQKKFVAHAKAGLPVETREKHADDGCRAH